MNHSNERGERGRGKGRERREGVLPLEVVLALDPLRYVADRCDDLAHHETGGGCVHWVNSSHERRETASTLVRQ